MTYANQFLKLSFLFTVAGTDEIAVTSLHLNGGTGFNATAALGDWDATAAQSIAGHYKGDLMDATGTYWGDYSSLVAVKMAAIDTDGNYVAGVDPVTTNLATTYTGTTNPVPIQCSRLLIVRSGETTGVANYGRMYLPHTSGPQTSGNPHVTSAATNALRDGVALFFNHVQAAASPLGSGASWDLMSAKGSGTNKVAAFVGTTNVIDTQRKRYNSLVVSTSLSTL